MHLATYVLHSLPGFVTQSLSCSGTSATGSVLQQGSSRVSQCNKERLATGKFTRLPMQQGASCNRKEVHASPSATRSVLQQEGSSRVSQCNKERLVTGKFTHLNTTSKLWVNDSLFRTIEEVQHMRYLVFLLNLQCDMQGVMHCASPASTIMFIWICKTQAINHLPL